MIEPLHCADNKFGALGVYLTRATCLCPPFKQNEQECPAHHPCFASVCFLHDDDQRREYCIDLYQSVWIWFCHERDLSYNTLYDGQQIHLLYHRNRNLYRNCNCWSNQYADHNWGCCTVRWNGRRSCHHHDQYSVYASAHLGQNVPGIEGIEDQRHPLNADVRNSYAYPE